MTLLTHFHVREQEQTLYGFATADERDLFRLLINRVTGVGPKIGIAILSGMSVRDFKRNVVTGDTAALSKISGVGKKTAERIILELKDKVGVADAWKDTAPFPLARLSGWTDNPAVKEFPDVDQIIRARDQGVPLPRTTVYNELADNMHRGVQRIMLNKADIKATLDEVATAVDRASAAAKRG